MYSNTLTEKIMKRVALYEKKRSLLWLSGLLVGLFIILSVTILQFFMVLIGLKESQTLEVLTIFSEETEIIQEYWQDIVSVIIDEFPAETLLYAVGTIVFGIIVIILTKKRRHIIQKKLQEVDKYLKKGTIEDSK